MAVAARCPSRRRRVVGSLAFALAVCLPPLSGLAAAEEAALERIAFGSCLAQRHSAPILGEVLAARPDLFLMIGDNVYGDVSSEALTELHEAYATLAANLGFRALAERVPLLTVWDDHDYGRNDAGGDFPYKERSEAIFEDFWDLPAEDPRRSRPGIYHARTFGPPGQRVQVILLDTRYFRSPLKPTDERDAPGRERYIPDPDPAKTMLGEAQWAWLAERLREPADLRLLVSSIQVIADGHGWEGWHTLPLERERLYATLRESGAEGLVILSGDRHRGGLYRHGEALDYPLYEVTSSSLNRSIDKPEAGPRRIGALLGRNNFGLIEIDWSAGLLEVSLRDEDGRPGRALTLSLADLRMP